MKWTLTSRLKRIFFTAPMAKTPVTADELRTAFVELAQVRPGKVRLVEHTFGLGRTGRYRFAFTPSPSAGAIQALKRNERGGVIVFPLDVSGTDGHRIISFFGPVHNGNSQNAARNCPLTRTQPASFARFSALTRSKSPSAYTRVAE
jgi:hypothetical protein